MNMAPTYGAANDAGRLRRRLADAVERLIAALDALDPDPDFEEQHDAEHDEAELSGIGDHDGLIEQVFGEPWYVEERSFP